MKIAFFSSYWIMQYIFPEQPFIGSSVQFIVTLYTFVTVMDNWAYFSRLHNEKGMFQDLNYYLVQGIVSMWLILLPITAVNRMQEVALLNGEEINYFIVLIAPALFQFVGYGWIVLGSVVKDKTTFLGKYCLGLNIILLILFHLTSVIINGGEISFLKLMLLNPTLNIGITSYTFFMLIIITLYLIPFGRTSLGSKLILILSLISLFITFPLFYKFGNEWIVNEPWYFRMVYISMMVNMIPQIFWYATRARVDGRRNN
jgi:hypothetical protein